MCSAYVRGYVHTIHVKVLVRTWIQKCVQVCSTCPNSIAGKVSYARRNLIDQLAEGREMIFALLLTGLINVQT